MGVIFPKGKQVYMSLFNTHAKINKNCKIKYVEKDDIKSPLQFSIVSNKYLKIKIRLVRNKS